MPDPYTSLPLENVLEILSFACQPLDPEERTLEHSFERTLGVPLALSQTCKHWRTLLHSPDLSRLWAYVLICMDEFPYTDYSRFDGTLGYSTRGTFRKMKAVVRQYLNRSYPHPFEFDALFPDLERVMGESAYFKREVDRVLGVLGLHADRWKRVSLRIYGNSYDRITPLRLPMLQSLSLEVLMSDPDYHLGIFGRHSFPYTPNLHTLHLSSNHDPIDNPEHNSFHQVRTLKITDYELLDALDVLQSTPSAREVQLDNIKDFFQDPDYPPISSQLQSLVITGDCVPDAPSDEPDYVPYFQRLFTLLQVPNLTSITITPDLQSYSMVPVLPTATFMNSFLQSRLYDVTDFTLTDVELSDNSDSFLTSLIPQMTSLVRLTLHEVRRRGSNIIPVDPFITLSFVECLLPGEVSLLPRLTYLELKSDLLAFDEVYLAQMIHARAVDYDGSLQNRLQQATLRIGRDFSVMAREILATAGIVVDYDY
ncbi:hypothetical protein K435DRAFT_971430 [Dendrothele bispora CBS 962.96]|uniref:F-box domain-containing protein n=1 Tax=Dendrothele bispora (strain CBS 962.96) TaxID=1314807 RepID=A0A4S8L5E6_DENBC|nr:hypothetical protein K435DRAFT_971430 [Dendrothele bispora CBS 962.96]